MSITFSIHAESAAEFRAFQSEGAPECNFSNMNAMRITEMIGLPMDDYYFMADAQDVLDGITNWVMSAESMTGDDMRRMQALGQVAQAALRVGRRVSGA